VNLVPRPPGRTSRSARLLRQTLLFLEAIVQIRTLMRSLGIARDQPAPDPKSTHHRNERRWPHRLENLSLCRFVTKLAFIRSRFGAILGFL
jgi:hypothetical protein